MIALEKINWTISSNGIAVAEIFIEINYASAHASMQIRRWSKGIKKKKKQTNEIDKVRYVM